MSSSAPAASDLQQRMMAAMQAHVKGRLDEARAAYEALLGEHPNNGDLLHALGTIHLQRKEWEKASVYLKRAIVAQPKQRRSQIPLANALAKLKKYDDAVQPLIALLTIDGGNQDALKLLFEIAHVQLADTTLAKHPIHRWIEKHPTLVPLHSVAASLCQTQGAHAMRLGHLEAVQKLGIKSENFYVELVKAMRDNALYERALHQCQEGLSVHPKSLSLLKLLGELHLSLSQYDEAIDVGTEVVRRMPDDHYARTTLGSIKLLVSDCREGYDDYAAHGDFAMATGGLQLPIPPWQGEKLTGKKLLLWSSQGIGDIVMFSSLLLWVLAQSGEVTLAVYKKLMPLYMRSFPGLHVIEHTPALLVEHAAVCDFHAALGQLIRYVLPQYEPAKHPPYLKADSKHSMKLRGRYLRYRAQSEGKRLIGISWSTTNAQTFSQRNIPLEAWQPFFDLPDTQLVSLQYGDHRAAIEAVNKDLTGALVFDESVDAYGDTDALAAQIAAMDEVVSIQNSTVHLAGALGVKTTLLLSAASDWRWGLKRTDSRWYRSVTIERQEKLLDWAPLLKRVAKRLAS